MSKLIELTITYPLQLKDLVEIAVADFGIENFVMGGSDLQSGTKPAMSLTCYLEQEQQVDALLTSIEKKISSSSLSGEIESQSTVIKQEDWQESWKQYWKPITILDKLIICPSWETIEKRKDQKVVVLDTTMAFGTGSHETTKLCLEFLIRRAERPITSLLDVGCGSGVLTISAAVLGAKKAVGIDIEDSIIETAKNNSEKNGIKKISFSTTPVTEIIETYDVVVANIISSVLLSIWPALLRAVKPGGELIISGILDEELEDLLADIGMEPVETRRENEWIALLFRL